MASDSTADPSAPMLVGAAQPSTALATPSMPPAEPDDWRRVVAALRTSKWLILAVTGIGSLAGVFGSRFLKPTYEAHATLWIEIPDRGARAREQGPFQPGELFPTATGWLDLLRSHVVLDAVVDRWRLYLTPKSAIDREALVTLSTLGEIRPGHYRVLWDKVGQQFRLVDVENQQVLQHVARGEAIGAMLGIAWVPPSDAAWPDNGVEFRLTATSEAALKLAEELRTRAAPEGNFVRIARRGPDPEQTTAIVNAVAERFVAAAADLKRQRLTELTAILHDQLDHSLANLRAAEAALTAFRVRNAVRPAEGPAQGPDGRRITADPTFASYVDVQLALDAETRDRTAIAELLRHAADSGAGIAVDQLTMIGAVQRSSELTAALKELTERQADLRALRFRYADTHPPVRRVAVQVDTLAQRVIPALARTLMAGLAARERELAHQRDSIAHELRSSPPVALSEIRLARDQANAEQLFSSLQQRYQEARLAEVSMLPDVRILERAVRPPRPTSRTAPLLIVAALLTSLGVGVAAAVVRERADPKVRYPEQVTNAMGLPILGAVPHVRHSVPRGWKPREVDAEDGARAIESLRGIRFNVHHASGMVSPLLATITSPGRGEGKSFVTANLAYAFSAVGYRTLLIDGDVRLGALHRTLRGARRPGLTDVLAGRILCDAAIQTTSHPHLSFIGAGSRMHRGPELLCSDGMSVVLKGLRSRYDVILVDSAPLAAGVDPYALGTATGNVLLVLRTGVTDRTLAEAKVEILHTLPLRVLGAILNDVRPGTAYTYYAYALSGTELREEDPHGTAGKMLVAPVVGADEAVEQASGSPSSAHKL